MVERGQDPPFVLEAAEERGVGRPAHDLERGALAELVADAFGEIHRPHAAAAQ